MPRYLVGALSLTIFRRERDWVLGEFKAGRSPILIATDVASRGLGTYSFRGSPHFDRTMPCCHLASTSWYRHPSRGSYGKRVKPVTIRQGSVPGLGQVSVRLRVVVEGMCGLFLPWRRGSACDIRSIECFPKCSASGDGLVNKSDPVVQAIWVPSRSIYLHVAPVPHLVALDDFNQNG